MTDAAPKGLHAKLAKLRATLAGVAKKTGTNTGVGGGYKFVEATEIARKFVEAASAMNVTMVPTAGQVLARYQSISGKQHVVDLEQTWTVTDADSGESTTVVSYGQGADNADKALPKAQTNGMKYAILLLLQAAGDDPEADGNTERLEAEGEAEKARRRQPVVAEKADEPAKPTRAVLLRLKGLFEEKGLGGDDRLELRQAFMAASVGKTASTDLTAADAEKLLVALAAYSGLEA